MLVNAIASALFSILSGCVAFSWESVSFLLVKCLEIGLLTSLAMLPSGSSNSYGGKRIHFSNLHQLNLYFLWIFFNDSQ